MKYLLFNFDTVGENLSETEIDRLNDVSDLTDQEYEDLCKQDSNGLIYNSSEDFESSFNSEHFSTATHQLRII
jgi:hypothetical protein